MLNCRECSWLTREAPPAKGLHLDVRRKAGQEADIPAYLNGQFPCRAKDEGLGAKIFHINACQEAQASSGHAIGSILMASNASMPTITFPPKYIVAKVLVMT